MDKNQWAPQAIFEHEKSKFNVEMEREMFRLE